MFKIIGLTLFCAISLSETSIIHPSSKPLITYDVLMRPRAELKSQWGHHISDFLELIDVEKVIGVVFKYINDSEVGKFLGFLIGPDFKSLIVEFESMAEFEEAFNFLKSQGYNVDFVLDSFNSIFGLPPYSKPQLLRNRKGVTGLIEDLFAVLPVKDMQQLFESKLETSPEVAQLFETINSEEFMDILRRMSKNPKFVEFKATFEGFGFDFKYLCSLAKEIFGHYYQGVFCE